MLGTEAFDHASRIVRISWHTWEFPKIHCGFRICKRTTKGREVP